MRQITQINVSYFFPLFSQVDDNIPLRVMLLLMDEVFDLKERNQWLRRNIKNLLQQLIRATYGDTINRYHFFKKKQQKTTKS